MTILTRFKDNIDSNNLIDKGDTIIVGASGGPDSQFLISLLNEIKEDYNLNIILAHLNHLHRKEAIDDENLVVETGKKLNLNVRAKRASMDEFAKENKISAEDAGRRLRYDFFRQIAKDFDNAKIAIAHNKDDQAETVLMRLIRGTGLDGLTGMDFKTDDIIRPILSFEKKEILAYLKENNISYALDQTNFSNDYTRNYIRNEIIPRMKDINPKVNDSIFSLSQLVKNDLEIIDTNIKKISKDTITCYSNEEIIYNKVEFESLPLPYQARILRDGIENLNGSTKDFSKKNIDEFISLVSLDNGKKIIKDDLEFSKSYRFYKLSKVKRKSIADEKIYIDLNEKKSFNGYTIAVMLVGDTCDRNKYIGYFDYDKLIFPLEIRTRKNGDKFKPIGFGHNKKLKDFFIDEKIDKTKRDQLPLVLSDEKIVWVSTYRMSEDYKIDEDTKKIVKIEVTND